MYNIISNNNNIYNDSFVEDTPTVLNKNFVNMLDTSNTTYYDKELDSNRFSKPTSPEFTPDYIFDSDDDEDFAVDIKRIPLLTESLNMSNDYDYYLNDIDDEPIKIYDKTESDYEEYLQNIVKNNMLLSNEQIVEIGDSPLEDVESDFILNENLPENEDIYKNNNNFEREDDYENNNNFEREDNYENNNNFEREDDYENNNNFENEGDYENNNNFENENMFKNIHRDDYYDEYNNKNNEEQEDVDNTLQILEITPETIKLYKLLHAHMQELSPNRIYIVTTANNNFLTYSKNNKAVTKSIRSNGFKGKANSTTYALKLFIKNFINKIKSPKEVLLVDLYAKPFNSKIKFFLTRFKLLNVQINKIYDASPIPYNGCRGKKLVIKKKRNSLVKYLSHVSI